MSAQNENHMTVHLYATVHTMTLVHHDIQQYDLVKKERKKSVGGRAYTKTLQYIYVYCPGVSQF